MEFITHSSSCTTKWRRGRNCSMGFTLYVLVFTILFSTCLSQQTSSSDELIYAKIKTEVWSNGKIEGKEDTSGTYGQGTRINSEGPIKGLLVQVVTSVNKSELGCSPLDPSIVPSKPWIALILRGVCNFSDKIYFAAKVSNASAVIIYNVKNSDEPADKQLTFDATKGSHEGMIQQGE